MNGNALPMEEYHISKQSRGSNSAKGWRGSRKHSRAHKTIDTNAHPEGTPATRGEGLAATRREGLAVAPRLREKGLVHPLADARIMSSVARQGVVGVDGLAHTQRLNCLICRFVLQGFKHKVGRRVLDHVRAYLLLGKEHGQNSCGGGRATYRGRARGGGGGGRGRAQRPKAQ